MTAKDFLSRGRFLEKHIEILKEHLEHYKSLVNNCTVTYSDIPKSTTTNYKLEDCTQKIIELQRQLCDDMADLVRVKCEISEAIRKVDNYEYQDILIKRYIFNEQWEKISDDFGFTRQHIHRIHGEALKKFSACYMM